LHKADIKAPQKNTVQEEQYHRGLFCQQLPGTVDISQHVNSWFGQKNGSLTILRVSVGDPGHGAFLTPGFWVKNQDTDPR